MEAKLSVFKTEMVAVDKDGSSTASRWLGIGSLLQSDLDLMDALGTTNLSIKLNHPLYRIRY